MNHHVKKSNRWGGLHLLFMLLAALMIGCAANAPSRQPEAAAPGQSEEVPGSQEKSITGIRTVNGENGVQVKIAGNGPLTYMSVKQPHPLAVVLYFKDTGLAGGTPKQATGSGVVSAINAADIAEGQSRIEILLAEDVDYTVSREDGGLMVSFPNSGERETSPALSQMSETHLSEQPGSASEPPMNVASIATNLNSISAAPDEKSTIVTVAADGSIHNYKSFTLENPPRIVFELFGLKSQSKGEQVIPVGSPWVKNVRYYAYPEKIRVVMDTTTPNLSRFGAWPVESGLIIRIGDEGKRAPVDGEVAISAPKQTVARPYQPVSGKPAWVNRIDFASEEAGKSTILIGTTEPAQYALKKVGDRLLRLTLDNTRLPEYRERPLITNRFQSAVDRILPVRKPGKPESAYFDIELREAVPYLVEQQDRLILVHFEASSVPPQSLHVKTLPEWESASKTALVANPPVSVETIAEEAYAPNIFAGKQFGGEKIALDFYETDLKNVFRILKEVSGKNFAIDKDVSGKVTLSFEKPVPWDQVMALILKMNQLGQVVDGDIIRIATLATLKKEEDERQAAIAAQQKAIEQQVALEPLITEYISVNYAKAKEEVLPHLQKIITEGRGNVTVDDRSNQIIITDVAAKIEQAKGMVKQLDNVTPQVIIEARIVEVNSSFSNELGISWNAQADNIQKNFLGGLVDWDVAMNYPVASTGAIGFNFTRIAGTPLILDARLSASEVKGNAKIISAPKIVTLDNKKAKIKQGLEIAYFERDDSGGSSVKFKNVDLLLEVTPHVTPDKRVSMTIFITKNDVKGFEGGIPTLSTNEAETELLVNDGDTIVIGGILKQSTSGGTDGYPGLSSIPVVSFLFKNTSSSGNNGELLIFITPQIVQLAQR
ncbi:MAG: type IV pilus secretin PilQ [Desulfobacterales bacterium]|jgi:type IV pilus assembly protein PilQ|nr:type IV pilus secretin PilQ [Desulfobacterales bacterium]